MLFLLLQNVSAQMPKHEIRAVWITTISGLDWPRSHSATSQQRELTDILDKLQQANINVSAPLPSIPPTTSLGTSVSQVLQAVRQATTP